ncbi:hypothetical protein LXA43DRAFT_132849 [Ganoderma leucocontextum]|nr:hypothetical protein LXA43DRAFT_132849 [Ganoderma leucocontextum]
MFISTGSSTPNNAHHYSVQTLPTELLRAIFILAVYDCRTTRDITLAPTHPTTIDIRPPLVLSQTCTRWRDIACDMPELWTALSNVVIGTRSMPTQTNKHLFVLFLVRAKRLPLSVLLTTDTRAANKLAPHMDHVRSLELVDFPDPNRLDLFSRPAPELEYLLLAPPQRASTSWRQSPVFFADQAPSLRALALFNPPFLPRQAFSTLTDLHIGGVSKPRLQDLLELLRGTPALESLAVVGLRVSLGFWLLPGQLQVPTVALRRLRRFALVRTPLTLGIALLAHLVLPRESAVHLLGLFADWNIDPLMTPLPPIAAANMLEMVVCGNTLSFHARVRAMDGSFASAPRTRCTAHRGTYTYSWWRGLWQTLPCAQLTELRVAVDAEDDAFLPRFLDAAIALTTLELRFHPQAKERRGENVLAHLDGAPQALLSVCTLLEQELPVVCPCLAELAVIDASSTPHAWDGFLLGEDTSPRVAYIPDILCVIAARAAAGRGLRRVSLQGRWRRAQRERVMSAFAMGTMVTDFVFRGLETDTAPLFDFEDDKGEEAWENEHWKYDLPKRTLPWAPVGGSD